jgi:hypothetical protein
MANSPEPALGGLIARAAEMRAEGETWQVVADAIGRSANTVKKWPKQHAKRWNKLFARAEAALLKDASSEAVHTLRKLLRSKVAKVQHDAAQKLLLLREARSKTGRSRERSGGSAVPEVRQLVEFLEGLSDGQFRELFDPPDPDALAPGHPDAAVAHSPRPAVAE